MRERFLDIVTLLAQYMLEEGRSPDDEQAIAEELIAEGYDPEDVREAFAWVERLVGTRAGGAALADLAGPDQSTRVLTPTEALKILPAAHGFLLRLRQLGLIDASVQERILERAMAVDADEIGLDEIKAIAALVLFNGAPDEWRGQLLDVLDDRRDRLYH